MNDKEQFIDDLLEFLKMCDFEKAGDEIIIVPNKFKFEDFPATVQDWLQQYFEYLERID